MKRRKKVWVADNITIPGGAEAVIDVSVEKQEGDDKREMDYVVESTKSLEDTNQMLMAATLVYLNTKPTCRVHVLNPFMQDAILLQSTLMGKSEEVENIAMVVIDAESENVKRVSVRRMNVSVGTAVNEAYEEAEGDGITDQQLD
ncbi:hypothetical protein DPMN_039684 [Dreissena polymorpha]|uniref:Uncharacterized protein n=1 Tax=Dreissena polymorpha TaxID=45954 RepID=A0A9D4CV92_DREPO|nr:hypothetical protein DPMN_039684 [Dreissena polymorpha]